MYNQLAQNRSLQRVSPCSQLSNTPGMATSSQRCLLPQHRHHLNVSQHVLIGCGQHRAFTSTRKCAHHKEHATTHPLHSDSPTNIGGKWWECHHGTHCALLTVCCARPSAAHVGPVMGPYKTISSRV